MGFSYELIAYAYTYDMKIDTQIEAPEMARANQQALADDLDASNNELLEYARNQQLIASLIPTNRTGRADPTVLRDTLVLSYQQAKNSAPGTPKHKFFNSVHKKMVRLSGGNAQAPEDWEVSELEVEILEGMRLTVIRASGAIFKSFIRNR